MKYITLMLIAISFYSCQEKGRAGIVTDKKSKDRKRNLIVHNVGNGQILEDCLFEYEIAGHFKYEK